MSKPEEDNGEVRLDPDNLQEDAKNNRTKKSRKTKPSNKSDRIMIFSKES